MKTLPAVYRDSSHTAILVERTESVTYYIPLATLKVEKLANKTFDSIYTVYHEYPVRRAAEVYLGAGKYRTIPAQAREHLSRIVADPATAYETFESTQGKLKMAKSPATSTARNGVSSAAEVLSKKPVKATAAPAPVASKKPVKATAEANTPAKALAKAVKAEPTKAPAKAPAPAKAAAPAAKTAAPAKAAKPAAVEAAKPGRTRLPDNVKFKVIDTSRVKRGFLQEFVERAQGLKAFTREQIEETFGGRANDAKMGTYFPYCVSKGIFAQA